MHKSSLWRHTLSVSISAFALLVVGAMPALATDQKDLTIGLKTLPLMESKITGSAVAAIVYDPANAASKADATAIKAVIDAGLTAPGGVTISGLMVTTAELNLLSQAKIAFVAQGTNSAFGAIASAASSAGVLTISTDLDCVKSSKCVLGVVSSPSVEIYYSKAAGDAAKIGFSQAFTMLVKQI